MTLSDDNTNTKIRHTHSCISVTDPRYHGCVLVSLNEYLVLLIVSYYPETLLILIFKPRGFEYFWDLSPDWLCFTSSL